MAQLELPRARGSGSYHEDRIEAGSNHSHASLVLFAAGIPQSPGVCAPSPRGVEMEAIVAEKNTGGVGGSLHTPRKGRQINARIVPVVTTGDDSQQSNKAPIVVVEGAGEGMEGSHHSRATRHGVPASVASSADEQWGALRYRTEVVLESVFVTAFMSLLTVYALFGDDLRVAAVQPEFDEIFYILSSVAFFSFAVEIILSCWAKPGYLPPLTENCTAENFHWKRFWRLFVFGSFFFWLDTIATASLAFDVRGRGRTAPIELVCRANLLRVAEHRTEILSDPLDVCPAAGNPGDRLRSAVRTSRACFTRRCPCGASCPYLPYGAARADSQGL